MLIKDLSRVTRRLRIFLVSITLFFFMAGLFLTSAMAGVLSDNYDQVKSKYSPFFNELISTQKVNETQLQAWIGDLDNYLSQYILNQDNFSLTMKQAMLNTLLLNNNKPVLEALNAAYGNQIEQIMNNVLPVEFTGFYNEVKTLVVDQAIMPDPLPGKYASAQTVKLVCATIGADIYYTLDGSTPGKGSTHYSGPVTVSSTSTLKAVAVKNDVSSKEFAFRYEMGDSPGGGGPSSGNSVVTSTTGAATVTPGAGGIISLGSEATVEVPANALAGTSAVEVKVQKVTTPPAIPTGFKLAGVVYEFSVGGKNSYSFAKNVSIKLTFDPKALAPGEKPEIFYYDEMSKQWISLGGTVSGNTVTISVNHFTKFAVMAVEKEEEQKTVTLTDITGHWALDNINKLVELGAISGYPVGSFKPDNTITRAEFATVLVKAFKLENKGGKTFSDTAMHWAKDYIAAAAAGGIVNGYDAGTFGPDDLITREQMAAMIVRAAGISPVAGEILFADSDSISGWAKEAIATATKNGIMKGYPDNTIQPRGNATRAEAVTVIVNACNG